MITISRLRFGSFIVLWILNATASAQSIDSGIEAYLRQDYVAAFHILSAPDEIDPVVQNLLGLMIYQGKGTSADPVLATDMFRRAAAGGDADACRNLGIIYSIGADGIAADSWAARKWFAQIPALGSPPVSAGTAAFPDSIDTVIPIRLPYGGRGKHTFVTFCAGCHGFSGMNVFAAAPSFAMGERMTKSDDELLRSILKGRRLMPSWEDKLPVQDLREALSYLRTLVLLTAYGTEVEAYDVAPEFYFVFKPAGMLDD